MDLELAKKLLSEKHLTLVDYDDKIYYDNREDLSIPLENHYGINIINNEWTFCFIRLERRNVPDIEILKKFENRSDAIDHLFLHVIRSYFFDKYIIQSRKSGCQINNLESIKIKMSELFIPEHYLCDKEQLKEHSICFYKTNNGWFESFIGVKNEIIATSKKGFPDEALFFSNTRLNSIYSLYLLDMYIKELLEVSNIIISYSDYQIANYLGYNI